MLPGQHAPPLVLDEATAHRRFSTGAADPILMERAGLIIGSGRHTNLLARR